MVNLRLSYPPSPLPTPIQESRPIPPSMKVHPVRLLTLCLLSLAGVSCTSPLESRLERNQAFIHSLPPADQILLNQGRIREGMGKTEVRIALGDPSSISERTENGRVRETWTYIRYRSIPRTTFISPPLYHWPPSYYHPYRNHLHHSYGYGPVSYTEYIPTLRALVVFENERVMAYELATR